MPIRVECYAGYRGEQEPRAFFLGERRVDVLAIEDRWAEPHRRWFRCRAADGHAYVLRHDERSGEWDIAAFTASRADERRR